MIPKEELLKLAKKEFATTLTMMRAFPAGNESFRVHERSSDARKLMSTFVFEMYLTSAFVFGDVIDRTKFIGYKPETLQGIIEDFRRETETVLRRLAELPDAGLQKQVVFNNVPFRADHFFPMMLCDQIHQSRATVRLRSPGRWQGARRVRSLGGRLFDQPRVGRAWGLHTRRPWGTRRIRSTG